MEVVNQLGIGAFKKQEKNRGNNWLVLKHVWTCTGLAQVVRMTWTRLSCRVCVIWTLSGTCSPRQLFWPLHSVWWVWDVQCCYTSADVFSDTGVVRGCVCLLLSSLPSAPQAGSKAQGCHGISSPMIMWGISVIGCHWFHWHLSPQRDKLQHELLKAYTCRSVSWLRQTMRFATLRRARRAMWTAALTLSDNLLPASQHRNFTEVWGTWAASVLAPHAELLLQIYCLEKFLSLQGFAKRGVGILMGKLGLTTGRESQTWFRKLRRA